MFEEVCCDTPASTWSYIEAPRDIWDVRVVRRVPSAGNYEQIVVILRRHLNHFPLLAIWQSAAIAHRLEVDYSLTVA